jgi:hypothetical protein
LHHLHDLEHTTAQRIGATLGDVFDHLMPHRHWKMTTFVAGLGNSGMVAPMVLAS